MLRHNESANLHFAEILSVRSDERFLEVGCGPGLLLQAAAWSAPDARFFGIDASSVMIRQSQRLLARQISTGAVELQVAPAERLPFADRTFDVVASLNSVMFWDDQRAGLAEMRRVVQPTGRVLIGVRSSRTASQGELRPNGPGDRAMSTLYDNLRTVGFDIASCEEQVTERDSLCLLLAVPTLSRVAKSALTA